MLSVDAPVVGQAPCYSCSMRRLTVVRQASCYSFSSMRRLTVHLIHRARLGKQGGRTSGTPDRTRGSLYVSLLHPPITARQARGPHQRNIRTRAWLSFCELTAPTDQDSASKGLHQRDTIEGARLSLGERSSPHRPSTARQARDRTIFLGQAPCCSFRVMRRPAVLDRHAPAILSAA